MKGKGYYDQNSAAQAESMRLLHGIMEEAIRDVPLPAAPRPLALADFGCSEGRNAIGWMKRIVDALRLRTDRPIFTFFSDLPTNDYNTLFANLHNPELVGAARSGVFAGAVAGSFYTQLLPPGTVQFASCINAILYLDRLPAPVPDFVIYRRPQGGSDTAFSRQAEEDLTQFLTCRARELVPGGKVLIATPGHDGQQHSCEEVYYVLNDSCVDLVKDGRLTQAQFERITIPVYFRTTAELRAPVEKQGSRVHDWYRVDRTETMEVPTPFVVKYRQERDPTAFADGYTGFLRAFTEPTVRAAVAGSRQENEVVDAVFDRIHARLRAEPERYLFHYVLTVIVLTRKN
jgi:hypothetical protein